MHQDQDWLSFRPRAFRWSTIIVALSVLGLLVIYYFRPPAPPAESAGWHLPENVFGLLQTLLATTLSIGLISVLFEYLLRKSWADDLLKFLRLNVAVSRAGIQHIGDETSVEWSQTLPHAGQVRALVRDPSKWLLTNLPLLMTAVQRRAADVLVGVPDPEGRLFADTAASIGLTEAQLSNAITVARQTVEAQWAAHKPHINDGSIFRIVTYAEIPMYEIVAVDSSTHIFLSRPYRHAIGDYALTIEFFQEAPQYPASWLRAAFEPLENANEILLRDSNT